jgi:hypothetical protein
MRGYPMGNGKSYLSGTVRWLGVAADVVACVSSGAPIGITTDPRPTVQSPAAEDAGDEEDDRAT